MLPALWKHAAPLPSFRSFTTSPARKPKALNRSQSPPPSPQRFAIIGGGFAGVAVAWHLMKLSSSQSPIQIELFDAHGLGSGGSGAAAGLLHPYTPRGTLLWQGVPAFQDSLDLINAAETSVAILDGELQQITQKRKQIVWRHGLLRPARTAKQAKDFLKNSTKKKTNSIDKEESEKSTTCDARCIVSYEELIELVPGLDPKLLFPDRFKEESLKTAGRKTAGAGEARAATGGVGGGAVGFYVEQGVVINPLEYLTALWESTCLHARTSSPLASAQLHLRSIPSLTELESQDGPFDGIVVAAGAAADSIVETAGVLNLDLCQGYTLDMELPEEEEKEKERGKKLNLEKTSANKENSTRPASILPSADIEDTTNSSNIKKKTSSLSYPKGAPGLLGSPYISPQGTHRAVVGATQRHGCSFEDALTALGTGGFKEKDSEEWNEAVEALVPAAAQLWPPLGVGNISSPTAASSSSEETTTDSTINKNNSNDASSMSQPHTWQIVAVRSGYRAIPQRTAEGSIPYAGKLDSFKNATTAAAGKIRDSNDSSGKIDTSGKNWWVVGGLGARGLVYHGWLGKLVAAGMVAGSDEQLPTELRRWKE